MLNPRKWKYEDRLRLLFATAFGAALGFTNGYSHGWFNILWALVGAVVVGGHFQDYQRLGDAAIDVLNDFTPLVERISIDEAFC
jgi:nucleotidyltransferase/DNA polymerase involved in DNA repair